MALRVGQWATGNVGRQALRSIIMHPELELVGVVVSDPAKVGKDAAELCGLELATGIEATSNPAELIARKPDCISYCALGTSGRSEVASGLRPQGAVEDLCSILSAGINVVSTSLVQLVHPPSADTRMVEVLEAACSRGRASCFTSGLDPGFVHDLLPAILTGLCARIDSVRISEIMCYGAWTKPEAIVGKFGFGKPLNHVPPLLRPGVLTIVWGGAVKLLAERLGVRLDRLEEFHEIYGAHESFDIPAAHIQKGMSAGIRFEVRGMMGDRAVIVVEHVTRLRAQDAPHWPQGPVGGGYRIQVRGEPDWIMDVRNPGYDDPTVPGTLATALRIVNAIPAVCAASPGLLTPFDLAPIIGHGRWSHGFAARDVI